MRSLLTLLLALLSLSVPICINASLSDFSLNALCEDASDEKNRFVAEIESKLREELEQNEPVKMEDDIRQVMRLYDGKLYGLQHFENRTTPQVACIDDVAKINLLLAFNKCKAHYTWNFAGISALTGGFWTHANRITVDISLAAPLNFNKPVPFNVTELRVTELDGLWVKYDGIEPFAWIASQIGNLGTSITKTTLRNFLQNNLNKILTDILERFPVG